MRTSSGSRALRLLALAMACAVPGGAPAAHVPAQGDVEAWIARCAGAWAGNDNTTPLGPMPFALVFDREADGSLHAHSALSQATWVDLRFHQDDHDRSGGWRLTESAAMEGLGEQSYTLAPTALDHGTMIWQTRERPDFLRCAMTPANETLTMVVHLRGQEHVRFNLARVEGAGADQLREALRAAAARPAGEAGGSRPGFAAAAPTCERQGAATAAGGTQLAAPGAGDGCKAGATSQALAAARAAVRAHPQDAPLHLALAYALAGRMTSTPPAELTACAAELYGELQQAVALDPQLAQAHFALARYYLEAPAIAGGSLDRAVECEQTLRRLGSPLGEVVGACIEAKQGRTADATARLHRILSEHPDLEAARTCLERVASSPSAN
jgi:hypothetical protein